MKDPCVVIVIVISNLEYGGAQRQVVEFANHAEGRGMHVHICSMSSYIPLASDVAHREERLHVIEKQGKYDVWVAVRLARLLSKLRADVVHGFLFDAIIASRLAGYWAGTPVVMGSERNTDYELKRIHHVAYRLTRRLNDLTVANSRAGAAFNSRVLGEPIEKYRVVHNGVNTERFHPQPMEAIRQRLGFAADDFVVGMFASFKEQKNHEMIFRAATRIMQEAPEARFLFVGDQLYAGMHGSDAYKVRMEQLVDELNLRHRCVFTGNVDRVEDYYPACDVTVLPSRFEGTPNVALESMACGVPVIATDVSDNREIIPDGRVGYIVALDDWMTLAERVLELRNRSDERVALGERAREWVVREFSVQRMAERMADVYREALMKSGHEAREALA